MPKLIKNLSAILAGFALSQSLAGLALAADPKPAAPPSITFGKQDAKLALAGTYALDSKHASVLARVSHIGYSYSIFRFDDVTGSLTWDPAKPEASKLSATVGVASIRTNVEGFAEELRGDKYLKSGAFPKATFTSTALSGVPSFSTNPRTVCAPVGLFRTRAITDFRFSLVTSDSTNCVSGSVSSPVPPIARTVRYHRAW